MVKTVFLYVSGSDYSAMDFEERHKDPTEVYRDMIEKGEKLRIVEEDECYFEIRIKEFNGIVDDELIDFLVDTLGDYDDLKHRNLYKVSVEY